MFGAYGGFQATSVKLHEYLGMNINFSDAVKVNIDMVDYIRDMIYKCTRKITGTYPMPEDELIFDNGKYGPLLKCKADEFPTIIANILFACKSTSPDIHTTIAALSNCI